MKRSAPQDNTKLNLTRLIEDIKHNEVEDIEKGSPMLEFTTTNFQAAQKIIEDYYEENYDEDYQENYEINYLATLIHLQNEGIEHLTIRQLENIEKYFLNILNATNRLAQVDFEDIENIFNNYDRIVLENY
jgi:hypothetical protein